MATYSEASAWCPVCGQWRLLRKQTMSRPALVIHIILSLTSAGLWLLVLGLHALAYAGKQHRCTVCGTAVSQGGGVPADGQAGASSGAGPHPVAPALPPPAPAANWYSDPRAEARLRYWDGESWTEHTAE